MQAGQCQRIRTVLDERARAGNGVGNTQIIAAVEDQRAIIGNGRGAGDRTICRSIADLQRTIANSCFTDEGIRTKQR